MPHVIMFLPVVSIPPSMWAKDVEEVSAGHVARSIAPPIMMQTVARKIRMPRIIMTNVVGKRRGSRKKITVLEGIVLIVRKDGEPFVESNLR